CGRAAPLPSDLWVLRYVWDREEQIEPLAALINGVLEQHADEPARHPLAAVQPQPDGEELARQLATVEQELDGRRLALSAVARLCGEAGYEAVQRRVLPVAGVRLYFQREGRWFRHGQHLPDLDVPADLDYRPLHDVLTPAPVRPLPPPVPDLRPVPLALA